MFFTKKDNYNWCDKKNISIADNVLANNKITQKIQDGHTFGSLSTDCHVCSMEEKEID